MNKFVYSENFYGNSRGGGVVMSLVKNLNSKLVIACSVVALAVCALVPAMAWAVDYPGYEEGAVTGTTAETQVGLKVDESQLSFTAPTVVNFAMNADGSFQVPTEAFIKNNSVMPIKVASYAVTSKSGATGVEDVTGQTGADTYQVKVKGLSGDPVAFAISSPAAWAGWLLGATGSATDTCTLTFSDGKMVNPTGSIWHDGAPLQEVVWTVTSNV